MYTKEQLLISLSAVIGFLGRLPQKNEMKGKRPGLLIYEKYFGSFEQALVEVQKKIIQNSVKKAEKREKKSPRQKALEAIREKGVKLGRAPVINDFREKGSIPSYRNLIRIFGSASMALREAGFSAKISPSEAKTEGIKKQIKEEIVRLAQNLGRLPTLKEVNDFDKAKIPTVDIIETVFGSLDDLFIEVGLIDCFKKVRAKHFEDSMIKKLQALAQITGGIPSVFDCDALAKRGSMFCSRTYVRKFGSWENSLKKAGIE